MSRMILHSSRGQRYCKQGQRKCRISKSKTIKHRMFVVARIMTRNLRPSKVVAGGFFCIKWIVSKSMYHVHLLAARISYGAEPVFLSSSPQSIYLVYLITITVQCWVLWLVIASYRCWADSFAAHSHSALNTLHALYHSIQNRSSTAVWHPKRAVKSAPATFWLILYQENNPENTIGTI